MRTDDRMLAALVKLKGSFERTGFDLGIYVSVLVLISGIVLIFVAFAILGYFQTGWTSATLALLFCTVCFSGVLYVLISRSVFRYDFNSGTLSAFGAWGQLIWSEDLVGLVAVDYYAGRGIETMQLLWADKNRSLSFFDSLQSALGLSVESSRVIVDGTFEREARHRAAPSWVCPGCHEENPGNFEECWKCQHHRPHSVKIVSRG